MTKKYCFISLIVVLSFFWQKGITQGITRTEEDNTLGNIELPIDSIAKPEELPQDSIKKKENAIDAPIAYTATDSMIMVLDGKNMLYLYGEGDVKYKNMNLTGEYIEIDADQSLVYATFGLDSIGDEFGHPIFVEGETQYEMKQARYNFKTKKMFITDVITQQGEGYVTGGKTKKRDDDVLFMKDVRYTTCDEHDHPHYYFHLDKAKVRPGKDIIFGSAHLVIEDVPLPIAVPFGFFPFSKTYSSGVIIPSYGDELKRGFSLQNGGYYFAFSDYVDLALTGDIYTKGSWAVRAKSKYKKRYKFSGNLEADYVVTVNGEKDVDEDYYKSNDFRILWRHSQDAKANPFSTFSASVDFTTSSYNRRDLNAIYSDRLTENEKKSSVNFGYRFPNSPFSINLNAALTQSSRNKTISATLPSLSVTMRDVYPFKRKEQVGEARWYENIRVGYSGQLSNSVTAPEDKILSKNLIKDWRNGVNHKIKVSATFNLFKYLNISPQIDYNERWYFSSVEKGYDQINQTTMVVDTTYGFKRVFDFSGSISASTKLYGFYKPWSIFGDKAKSTQIRHVLTPSVSFSGAPDFTDPRFGYYKTYHYYNAYGELVSDTYSPYENGIFSVPNAGETALLSFSLDNNIEMKVPIAGTDSTKKITLIDQLSLRMSYNFLAEQFKWSDLSASLRLKFGNKTFAASGSFDTYTYDENGTRVDIPRWEAGKGIGRFRGTNTSFSYTFNNAVIKSWFSKDKDDEDPSPPSSLGDNQEQGEEDGSPTRLRQPKKGDDLKRDANGYWVPDIPWSLTVAYGLGFSYDYSKFNKEKKEYDYKWTQTLAINGNIKPTKNWNLNFSTNYDFEAKKFVTMNCSVSRDLHCWNMSASFMPVGPYKSYTFTISVNASMLRDLKYTQSSSPYDTMNWGN